MERKQKRSHVQNLETDVLSKLFLTFPASKLTIANNVQTCCAAGNSKILKVISAASVNQKRK